MNSLSKDNDPKFSRMVIRDAIYLLIIMFFSFLACLLIPLLVYLGQKYDF